MVIVTSSSVALFKHLKEEIFYTILNILIFNSLITYTFIKKKNYYYLKILKKAPQAPVRLLTFLIYKTCFGLFVKSGSLNYVNIATFIWFEFRML